MRRGTERERRLLEVCRRRECSGQAETRAHGRTELRSKHAEDDAARFSLQKRHTNTARRKANDKLQMLDWNRRFSVNPRFQQIHVFTCKYYCPLNQGSLDGRLISGLWKGRLEVRTNIWYGKVSKYSENEDSAASRKGFPLLHLIHCVKQETTPKTQQETISP